jgi:hypothetical protein
MSRYYRIEIDGGPTYTSFANGVTNPAALQVELDIPVAPFDSPAAAGAFVKVWGIPLSDISQAKNLSRKNIKVYGGFQKGLPLANPAQSGLLVRGYIFQSFGNWIGIDQSLDLIIAAGAAPADINNPSVPPNLTLNWLKGQPLADAIKSALTTAYPGYTTNININPNLKYTWDEPSFYESLDAFARYVKATSKAIIKTATYPGVSITLDGTVFSVYDNTPPASSPTIINGRLVVTPSSTAGSTTPSTAGSTAGIPPAKTVAFQDLIGQPTWIEAPFIQFKTMMRADLKVGDQVTLPKTFVNNSAQAQSSLINQEVAFQGKFQIQTIRHVGNYRQATADAWVTVFDAFPLQVQAA